MNKYKTALLEAGAVMLNKGLTVETWGNLSIRDPESGKVYITPSAMAYNKISEADIAVLDKDGSVLEGRRKPSIEKELHLLIYENRADVNAVMHTHPVSSCVFAVLRRNIPVITDEMAQAIGGCVECAAYALPGSKELAQNALKALGTKQACLLANHGAVCVGADFSECFKVAAVLESSAEIFHRALSVGTPVEIEPENVSFMRDFAKTKYKEQPL